MYEDRKAKCQQEVNIAYILRENNNKLVAVIQFIPTRSDQLYIYMATKEANYYESSERRRSNTTLDEESLRQFLHY
jgi:hypothetical protein